VTGVVMGAAAASGPAGYSGSPGSISWANINAISGGSTNTQTLSGVTGSMSVSAAITGGGLLIVNLGGASPFYYAGQFEWAEGQTLSWTITSPGGTVSGTVTVENATAGTVLDSFTYIVKLPTGGGGGGFQP
jgi:hypothetical protein